MLAAGLCVWQSTREVPGRPVAAIDPRRSGFGDYDPHAALERW